jgi:cell division septation protein DedD
LEKTLEEKPPQLRNPERHKSERRRSTDTYSRQKEKTPMKKRQSLSNSRCAKVTGGIVGARPIFLTLLGVAWLCAAHPAAADDFVWTGGGGGSTNWNNPANWQNVTPGGTHTFPDSNDNVTFSSNATVGGDGAAASLSTGGSATLSIASGAVTIFSAINNLHKITYSGSNINNEILRVDGATTLSGGGEVQLVNSHSFIYTGNSSTLNNVDNLIHGGNGGSINLPMINSGNIFADNGTLNVTSTLTQTSSGTISVFLNGTNFATSGLLAMNNVTLAGTLKLVVGGTFSASVGATYRIITANTLNGTTFDTVDQSMTNGSSFTVTYGANFVDVTVSSFVPPTPTPTPSPSTSPTPTATATATPASTPSPTPVATPTATATAAASATPTPTPTPVPGQFGNIATRLRVETGDNVLIGGFIVTGTQPKRVILRAIGPSLTGVPGALANPTLELHGSSGLIASNDNWKDAPNRQEIIDSTVAPTNDFESAILVTLPADDSHYTAVVRGVNNGTGIGVVEAYDLDTAANSKLANISTRGFVQTGDDVMIGGLIVVGQSSTRVIVRAIGPSLSIPGNLADPILELRDGNGTLLQVDDNWRTGGQEAEIIATTIPPSNDLESAIVRTLSPGNYTAIMRGVGNGTGIGVVEAYDLGPP